MVEESLQDDSLSNAIAGMSNLTQYIELVITIISVKLFVFGPHIIELLGYGGEVVADFRTVCYGFLLASVLFYLTRDAHGTFLETTGNKYLGIFVSIFLGIAITSATIVMVSSEYEVIAFLVLMIAALLGLIVTYITSYRTLTS